jgi:hypothetical protein
MANTVIQLKHSTETGNVPSSLANGEISINNRDGKFFYSTPANVVITHYPYPGPAGLNQEIQFNDSGVLGSDSDLSFNKTTDVLSAKNIVVSGNSYFGNVFVTGGLFPSVDNTGVVGNSAFTWDNGQFTDLTIDNILNVRTAIDLADGDILRFGTNDDWEMFHDGTANRIDLNNGDLTIRDDGTAGDPTRFTFGRTTGNFTANGNVSAINFLVGSLNVNEHAQSAFDTANSAGSYANSAFAAANAATAIDTTQNNSITAAFIHANAAFDAANTSGGASIGDVLALSIALG